jgi:hypothetical protein
MAKVKVSGVEKSIGEAQGLMLVRVRKDYGKDKFGWYGGKRCRPGEEFFLFKPEDFSANWMEVVKATQDQRNRVPMRYRKAVGGKAPEPETVGAGGAGGKK